MTAFLADEFQFVGTARSGNDDSDCVESWYSINGGGSYTRAHRWCRDGGSRTYSANLPSTATQVRLQFRFGHSCCNEGAQLDDIFIEGLPRSTSISYTSSAVVTGGIGVNPPLSSSRTVASTTRAVNDKPILLTMRVTPSNSNRNSRFRMSVDGIQVFNGERAGFTDGSPYMYHITRLFESET